MKKPLALDFLVGFKVKSISTSRYFSAASLRDNIKIWGDIETTLNIQAKSISCGVRFLLIAMENEVMVWGSPSYDTSSASSDLKKIGSISSVKIASGLAHGLVLDRSNSVYVFGFGEKGELGLGPSLTYSESLVKLDLSEISNILCHGQISVAISKNIVYVWGLVNPECLESSADIQWAPEGLILPSNVTCAGIGGHELLAMCEDLKIYIWEWKFSKRFKKMLESYQSVVNIRDICVGRSMHVLLQGVLIGQMTEIVQCPDTANSHEPFIMNIQLFDQFGPVSFKSPNVEIYFGQGKENTKKSLIEFAVSGDSELEITPFGFGKFCIHVLVNNCEAKNTKNIEILPSQADLQSKESLEEKQQKDLEKEREKQEKLRKAEEEQKKAAEALEESARKKKEETGKRAQEALKSHREKTEHDKEKEEKERKQRLEMKTGGGYDLKKKKK